MLYFLVTELHRFCFFSKSFYEFHTEIDTTNPNWDQTIVLSQLFLCITISYFRHLNKSSKIELYSIIPIYGTTSENRYSIICKCFHNWGEKTLQITGSIGLATIFKKFLVYKEDLWIFFYHLSFSLLQLITEIDKLHVAYIWNIDPLVLVFPQSLPRYL